MTNLDGPILITGANGFLGQHICHTLLKEGYEVVAIVHKSRDKIDNLAAHYPMLSVFVFDLILANEALPRLSKTPKALIHAAGLDPTSNSDFRPNIKMARTVSIIARKMLITCIVNISSHNVTFSCRGNYASSKLIVEQVFNELLQDCIIHTIRPTLIYDDSGNEFIDQLIKLGRRIRMIPLLGLKDSKLQPVHAFDVASAVVHLVNHGESSVYSIAGRKSIGLHTITIAIARHVVALPIPIPQFFMKFVVLGIHRFKDKVFELYEKKTLDSDEIESLQFRFGLRFRSFKEDLPKILRQKL